MAKKAKRGSPAKGERVVAGQVTPPESPDGAAPPATASLPDVKIHPSFDATLVHLREAATRAALDGDPEKIIRTSAALAAYLKPGAAAPAAEKPDLTPDGKPMCELCTNPANPMTGRCEECTAQLKGVSAWPDNGEAPPTPGAENRGGGGLEYYGPGMARIDPAERLAGGAA